MDELKLELTTDAAQELTDLFDMLVDESGALQQENITFEARTAPSTTFGAGVPEVTQLIVALGSAGAFAALSRIFVEYFRNRPTGRIVMRAKGATITVRIDNCRAEDLSKAVQQFTGKRK